MRIISRKRLREAEAKHADLVEPLAAWWNVAKAANWTGIEDVKRTYPYTDPVGRYTVFDIKGNSYRLIVRMEYKKHLIFIIKVLTHAEYDKGAW
jgi:mRNA interferase HigB